MKEVLQNPWVRAVGTLAALVLIGLLAYVLRPVLVPLMLALLVAYVLDPVVDVFEARRIPRMVTIIGLAIVGLVLLASVPLIIMPSVFGQAMKLAQPSLLRADKNDDGEVTFAEIRAIMPDYTRDEFRQADLDGNGSLSAVELRPREESRATALLDSLLDRLPVRALVHHLELDRKAAQIYQQPVAVLSDEDKGVALVVPDAAVPAVAVPEDELSDVDARALLAEYIGRNMREFAIQFAKSNTGTLASLGQRAGMNLFGVVSSVGQALVNFLLFLANFALFAVVTGYLLKDFDPLKANVRALIPPRYKPKMLEILGAIDDQLRSFLRGQLTVCVCLGVMYTIGFLIFGVPFALLLGIFSIAASFIPFVGVLTTAVLAVLLTILAHGIDYHLFGVLGVVAVAQFLEGNVLTPRIVGEKVGLNPVWVILAIMVFGNFLGFLGLLLAVPIAAALKVLVVEGVAYYKASPVFDGVEAPDSDPAAVERRKKRR